MLKGTSHVQRKTINNCGSKEIQKFGRLLFDNFANSVIYVEEISYNTCNDNYILYLFCLTTYYNNIDENN